MKAESKSSPWSISSSCEEIGTPLSSYENAILTVIESTSASTNKGAGGL